MLCNCIGCGDPHTHLTSVHICPICYKEGHGAHECGPGLRPRLRRTELSRMPTIQLAAQFHCDVPGCTRPSTHTTEGHPCSRCGKRSSLCGCGARGEVSCPQPPTYLKGIRCPICRKEGTANLFLDLFTGTSCVICRTNCKLCSIMPCGHVHCCRSCLLKMTLH